MFNFSAAASIRPFVGLAFLSAGLAIPAVAWAQCCGYTDNYYGDICCDGYEVVSPEWYCGCGYEVTHFEPMVADDACCEVVACDPSDNHNSAPAPSSASEGASPEPVEESIPEPRQTFRAEESAATAPEPATSRPTPAEGTDDSSASLPTPGVAVPSSPADAASERAADPQPGPADGSQVFPPAPEPRTDQSSATSPLGDRYSTPAQADNLPGPSVGGTNSTSAPGESVNGSVESIFDEPAAGPRPSLSTTPPGGPAGSAGAGEAAADPAGIFGERLNPRLDSTPGTERSAAPTPRNSRQESIDELFESTQSPSEPGDDAPASEGEEAPDDEESTNSLLDDLLGEGQPVDSDGVFQGQRDTELRTWRDRSGKHSCQARLIRFTARGLLLERADGVAIELSFSDLSDDDLAYADREVEQARMELARRRTAAQLAGGWGR